MTTSEVDIAKLLANIHHVCDHLTNGVPNIQSPFSSVVVPNTLNCSATFTSRSPMLSACLRVLAGSCALVFVFLEHFHWKQLPACCWKQHNSTVPGWQKNPKNKKNTLGGSEEFKAGFTEWPRPPRAPKAPVFTSFHWVYSILFDCTFVEDFEPLKFSSKWRGHCTISCYLVPVWSSCPVLTWYTFLKTVVLNQNATTGSQPIVIAP